MLNRVRNEPALVSGAVTAVLALLITFGLDLTAEQVGAILAVVAAGLAFVVRGQVTPTAKGDHEAGEVGNSLVWVLAVVGIVLLVLILVGKLNV